MVGVAVFCGAYWIAAGLADPIVVKTATTAARPSVAKAATSIRDVRVGLCINVSLLRDLHRSGIPADPHPKRCLRKS
jgi:hypothetical protein